MAPLMAKLNANIPQPQFGGMGDPMGGMGMGLNQQQLEQLQALQAQDPQAF